MPAPDIHARSHLPGGTDPLPVSADLSWANAIMFSTALAPTGGRFRPRFQYCATNAPDIFALDGISSGKADYLFISEPGYYVARFGVVTSGGAEVWGATYALLEPLAKIAGADSPIDVSTDGYSDWTGSDFARGHEQFSGEFNSSPAGHRGLWTEFTFNYDPANPQQGDLSFESPLGIALRVGSTSSDTITMTASVNIIRIAATPGYTLQDVTV